MLKEDHFRLIEMHLTTVYQEDMVRNLKGCINHNKIFRWMLLPVGYINLRSMGCSSHCFVIVVVSITIIDLITVGNVYFWTYKPAPSNDYVLVKLLKTQHIKIPIQTHPAVADESNWSAIIFNMIGILIMLLFDQILLLDSAAVKNEQLTLKRILSSSWW